MCCADAEKPFLGARIRCAKQKVFWLDQVRLVHFAKNRGVLLQVKGVALSSHCRAV